MRRTILALLSLLLGAVSLSLGDTDQVQVQIALYPYLHDVAPAWQLSILADGTVRYEESAEPVKVLVVTGDDGMRWVAQPSHVPKGLSPRKREELLRRLRALDLHSLRFRYSAGYTFTDPTSSTRVTEASGESFTAPAEVERIVTHGATYRLRVVLGDVLADSVVYAPFSALEWENPEHPDRAAIAKIVAGWYYVLHAVGPVNGNEEKMFRRGIE